MRSYFVEELHHKDMRRLLDLLQAKEMPASIKDLFWLPVPESLLTEEQRAHLEHCGPFVASLETGDTWLKAELLIRAQGRLRCSCINYATVEQRNWLISQVDAMLRDLDITV